MDQLSFPGIEDLGRQALAEQQRVDRPFHVTAPVEPHEFKAGQERAAKQDALILEFFLKHAGEQFTAFEVHHAVAGPEGRADKRERWPLTSTRRSLSNLRSRKLIRRHSFAERRDGEMGVKNYVWSLVEGEQS